MRVRIKEIHKLDAYHDLSKELVNLTGEFSPNSEGSPEGWYGGEFTLDNPFTILEGGEWEYYDSTLFYAVRYEEIE
jgi:hypothetical protein